MRRSVPNLLAFVAVAAAFAGAPSLAHGHGQALEGIPVPSAPDGSAEAKLRKVETEQLGPEHAAVHAQQRAIAQQELAAEQARPQAAAQARAVAVAATPLVAPADGGSWSSEIDIPVIAINAIMIPKGPAAGKILMFAYPGRPGFAGSGYVNLAHAYLWDPVSQTSEQVDPPIDPATGKPTNIWCGGASVLADGRVLVTGGNVGDPTADYFGLNNVFTFDPVMKKWHPEPPMRQGRWYPSQLLMPDARTLIMAGKTRPGDPDFHQTTTGEFRNSDIETFSPGGSSPDGSISDGSIERDDLQLGQPGAPGLTGLYPHMFWTPSGRALVAGPQKEDSWYVDPGGRDQATAWTDVPNLSRDRNWGTSVLVGNTVWMLGGSPNDAPLDEANHGDQPATDTVEALDDAAPGAGWVSKPAMKVARSHANSVLLPGGKVATIGGGYGNKGSMALYRWIFSDEQKQVELLDPSTGQSTLGAAQVEGRSYHSTALLLPDGRVFSAGDDINGKPAATDDQATSWDETRGEGTGASSDTAEIYSPPYLFKSDGSPAPRPVLGATPPPARLGADFEVSASGEPATKAVLVAPGAATHAVDMSQRLVNLAPPVAGSAGHLKLHIPSDPNVVLPGYYMLFLLSADGVPSKAKFIQVEAPPDTTKPAVSLTAPADGSSSDDTTPTYAGTAGNLAGDRSTVTVRVYEGTAATGAPVQTRATLRSGTSWTVDGSSPLPVGTYTAQAEQSDYAGNTDVSDATTFTIVAPPAPPPGPSPAPPPPPLSKPTLTISGALPSLRTLKRKKRFRLTVALSEPGTVTLQGRLERGTHQAKTLVRQRKVTFSTVRRRRVTFTLTRAGLRLLAHRRRGVVRIRATSLLKSGHTLPTLQVRRKLR